MYPPELGFTGVLVLGEERFEKASWRYCIPLVTGGAGQVVCPSKRRPPHGEHEEVEEGIMGSEKTEGARGLRLKGIKGLFFIITI